MGLCFVLRMVFPFQDRFLYDLRIQGLRALGIFGIGAGGLRVLRLEGHT